MPLRRTATIAQLVTWFKRRKWPPSELIAQADGSASSRSISGVYEDAGLVERRRDRTVVATPKLHRVAEAFGGSDREPQIVGGRIVR